jgi:hypothetical protein
VAEQNHTVLQAEPTKDLFVDTLVRDIPLDRAILDLVDNSVDGANRLRPTDRWIGLHVKVHIDRERFVIDDNCGGIPLEEAKKYAFRWGRPEGARKTPHSIGQFGVGMKRALFKMGEEFSVKSTAANSVFEMRDSVGEWKNRNEWSFPLTAEEAIESEIPVGQRGTKIEITKLHSAVASSFSTPSFRSRLQTEIAITQQNAISRGLDIRVNDIQVDARPLQLAYSPGLIEPSFLTFQFNGSPAPVNVRLYAGVINEDLTPWQEAGWYIFCNDRLIISAEQSQLTGWGETEPKFHPQYNRFRGYGFFDCEDPSRLPWNTTKTGIDTDSPIYEYAKGKISDGMGPVLVFLGRYAKETQSDEGDKPLHEALAKSKMLKLEDLEVPAGTLFVSPNLNNMVPDEFASSWIRFKKPRQQVTRAGEVLGKSRAGEIGSAAFDYFYENECGD